MKRSTAIAAVQVGEHIKEVAEHVAAWLTECLQKKMSPAHFKKIWERHFKDEDSLSESFVTYLQQTDPDGAAVVCWDDPAGTDVCGPAPWITIATGAP